LTGCEFEAETYFATLGMSIQVLAPGEPNSMYHWETEQEETSSFSPARRS
jgi:uncharacterized cupin superfamily protein